jgi:hypothetical protein
MPFGKSGAEYRKSILNFRRLKYIIEEKCEVVPTGRYATGNRLAYDVKVAKTSTDQIPRDALSKISSADILIALLSERNPTVTYELGYRRALESDTPVILLVDSRDDLPIYESAVAYQEWPQDDVLGQINSIAGNDFPALDGFEADMPGALKDVIDARDSGLIKNLSLALQEIESKFEPPAPQKLRAMLSSSITRFYPFSVVEVAFTARGEFEDPNVPAMVIDFDDEFSRLYDYVDKTAAKSDTPFTLNKLLERIERYVDSDDWNEFLREQVELTETVVKNYGFARARVPLRFNSSHPHPQFNSKSFLPCMAAQVIDGDRTGPHRMYLLIVYVEVGNGVGCSPTRERTNDG